MFRKQIATAVACLTAALAWGQGPVVKVDGGRVQGIPSAASGVTVFRGIPYAAPPVGEFRWKRPQPVVKWQPFTLANPFVMIFNIKNK